MKVKFSRCTSSNLANVPQVDGQLIYTKDTGEVYLDVGSVRNKISDVQEADNILNIASPIINKLYYDKNTDTLNKAKLVDGQVNWINLTGASIEYVNNEVQGAKDYTDEELRKYVPLRSFPSGVNTSGTTVQFFSSIQSLNLPTGTMLLGLVTLTDMPVSNLRQAEVQVEVYKNNVLYCTMKSADTYPYIWTCNSYNYTGWSADSVPTAQSTTYNNTTSGLTATDVQGAIDEINTSLGNIDSILDNINGEVV